MGGVGGLFATVAATALSRWVGVAHDGGLSVALAGSLGGGNVERVRDLGADIMGVRGAVCEGGREGRVSVARVRELAARVRGATEAARVRPTVAAERGPDIAPRE